MSRSTESRPEVPQVERRYFPGCTNMVFVDGQYFTPEDAADYYVQTQQATLIEAPRIRDYLEENLRQRGRERLAIAN